MAQVLGESGRYVSEEAVRKLRKIWAYCVTILAITEAAVGFLLGFWLQNIKRPIFALLIIVPAVGIVWIIWRWSERKLKALEKQRMAMRKGAVGEAIVGGILNDLPEEYRVIHDLSTPCGNLDHVVIGPKGVFIVDAKNWRGVVTADGNGELLWNTKPTDKAHVRAFSGRLMGVREQVKNLMLSRQSWPERDPFFQGVFAFVSARVEADWGKTGSVHCMREDQLWNYIVESKAGRKLAASEIEVFAQAFLALATMEKGFESGRVTPKAS